METKSFFGENGLTSTSANHYANLAKEAARKVQNYLENVRFYNTDIRIIGENTKTNISQGLNVEGFDKIQRAIHTIAQCNSLIAFFREAIKEKERLAHEAEQWEDRQKLDDYTARRRAHEMAKPKRGEHLTEEDVIKSWTIGEQEKYLSLEAEAAAYGKFIHEDGKLSQARRDLMKIESNPNSVKENGRDTIIYTYTPTADQDDVDELFFDLQSHYREVQAELNGMKKRIQDTIDEHNTQVDEAYRTALKSWNLVSPALDREYETIINDESAQRQKMLKEIQALKIVVPNRLKEIFDALKELG